MVMYIMILTSREEFKARRQEQFMRLVGGEDLGFS